MGRGPGASQRAGSRYITTSPRQMLEPSDVSIAERFRRLPEALLLTAGYYGSRLPWLGELLRRLD
jgi:hypothetical protein